MVSAPVFQTGDASSSLVTCSTLSPSVTRSTSGFGPLSRGSNPWGTTTRRVLKE